MRREDRAVLGRGCAASTYLSLPGVQVFGNVSLTVMLGLSHVVLYGCGVHRLKGGEIITSGFYRSHGLLNNGGTTPTSILP